MRKIILAATLIAAAIWHPPARADALLNAYTKALPDTEMCAFLKYKVDSDAYQSTVVAYIKTVRARSPAEAQAGLDIMDAAIAVNTADMDSLKNHDDDEAGLLVALDRLFQKYNAPCLAKTRNPTFSPYFKPSQFALSGQPQTTLNWIKYYANPGDSFAMMQMGQFYINGIAGMPKNRHTGYVWLEKSADAGDARYTPLMKEVCDARLKGVDLPKDNVTAAKWCYLTRTLDPAMAYDVAPLESQLTPDELAAGQKLGDEWLAAHPPTAQ